MNINMMCNACRYNPTDDKIRALMNISHLLDRLNLNINSIKNYKRYNWGADDTCKYGIGKNCDKIREHNRKLTQYINQVELQLSAFLEQNANNVTYMEILRYLRGNFPSVYSTFGHDYYKVTNN